MTAMQSALVDRWHDPDVWTTGRVAPHKQFDCWRAFVVDAHMHWAIRPIRCDRFPAYIRQGRFDGFRVTHLTARQGGIVGTRGAREIALDDEALFNLIYIAEGSIQLEIGDEPVDLVPGTFALWDTTRPMRFTTGENLRQVTFAVPQSQLQRVLPRAADYVGRRVDAGSGVSRLFVDHLLSLDDSFGELPRASAGHVLNATMELLAATLSAKVDLPETGNRHVLLRQAMDTIERRLGDAELSTHEVAVAIGVSERHLHRLFEDACTTPAAWIRERRLARCDSALRESPHASITEIAYRWGFRDSGTFAKIYRRAFGFSPRDARRITAASRSSAPGAPPARG
ncbi:MAG TPA: helix-turn-helix domain-containing protein [Nevskiaceae bacterium]|nr:helix-turn-helix domain-containing protein [Nevskiaceae bacterium]